jgi:hypothetical protein
VLQSTSWRHVTGAKTEGAQSAQTPRRLEHPERLAQGDQGAQGLERLEHPEHAKSLWVYRHAHGAALGGLSMVNSKISIQ